DPSGVLSAAIRVIKVLRPSYDFVFTAGFYSITAAQAHLLGEIARSFGDNYRQLLELPGPNPGLSCASEIHPALASVFALFDGFEVLKTDQPRQPAPSFSLYESSRDEAAAAAEWAAGLLASGVSPGDIAVLFPAVGANVQELLSFMERLGVPFSLVNQPSASRSPAFQALERIVRLLRHHADPVLIELIACAEYSDRASLTRDEVRAILRRARLRRSGTLLDWSGRMAELSRALAEPSHRASHLPSSRSGGEVSGFCAALAGFLNLLAMASAAKAGEFRQAFEGVAAHPILGPCHAKLAVLAASLCDEILPVLRAVPGISPPEAALFAVDGMDAAPTAVPVPDAVAVASLLSGRHLLRKHLFIGGLNEEAFPFSRSFVPFFPALADCEGISVPDRAQESEHIYFLLTRRAEKVVLSAPRAKGYRALAPSFYFSFEQPAGYSSDKVEVSPSTSATSPWGSASALGSCAFGSDRWSRAAEQAASSGPGHSQALRGALAERIRTSTPLSAFAGALADAPYVASLADVGASMRRTINVTDIEHLLVCPLRFFFRHMLATSTPVDAGEQLLPADEKGLILHRIAAEFYRDINGDRARFEQLLSNPEPRMLEALKRIVSELRETGSAPYLLNWAASLGLATGEPTKALRRFIEYEREVPFLPMAVEKDVRGGIVTPSGTIELKGRIDRIDRGSGDSLWVVDYKTTTPPAHKNVKSGRSTQLQFYAALVSLSFKTDNVLFCHYSLGRDVKRSTGRMSPKNFDSYINEGRSSFERLLPLALATWAQGRLNRVFEQDLSGSCGYSSLCRSLCNPLSAVQAGEFPPDLVLYRGAAGPEEPEDEE
ncbi:MAG: PD-(D/E)XK nuclease family protein, partial [Candidatus Brocadiia bacterium]